MLAYLHLCKYVMREALMHRNIDSNDELMRFTVLMAQFRSFLKLSCLIDDADNTAKNNLPTLCGQ